MDNFIGFLCWTALVAGLGFAGGLMTSEKYIIEQCIGVGTIDIQNHLINCDPKFVRSNGKVIRWSEVPEMQ